MKLVISENYLIFNYMSKKIETDPGFQIHFQ